MAEGGRVLIKCRFEDDATELEVFDADFPFQVFYKLWQPPWRVGGRNGGRLKDFAQRIQD